MFLSRIWKRGSHVGRRVVTLDPIVKVELLPFSETRPTPFGQTKISKIVTIQGPLGSLQFPLRQGLQISILPGLVENEKVLKVDLDDKVFDKLSKYCKHFVRAMWGTTASRIRQHVEGVVEGYEVPLKLVGVGYKASIDNGKIKLKVGYTHDILVPIPEGITAVTPIQTKIILSGCDYQKVTQFAAKIRSFRKPEPYNGKGVFVGNETITLKEGKKK